jgi:hypothetical protein
MSTARARALREKNAVAKLVKDLNKKMDSFEDAVEELKILKDSITEMNDQIAEQEQTNVETMKRLKADLKDNRTRTLNEAVEEMGKVIVSTDELEEYKAEAERWKAECGRVKLAVADEVKEKVEEQVDRQLKILELQNECKTAELNASNESFKKEVQNLKEAIGRMSEELNSQKKLTADVARVGRPVQQQQPRTE